MSQCPSCNAPLEDGAKFCEKCGAQIAAEAAQPKKLNISKKTLGIGGAIVAVIAVIAIVVSLFAPEANYALYRKDGDLYFTDSFAKGKSVMISDEYAGRAQVTEDGKTIFFVNEDGKLVYRTTGKSSKEAKTIASEVDDFYINADGSLVTYMKSGALYQHNLKDSTKISDDVSQFVVSADGKKIIFMNKNNDLYLRNKGKKENTKITSEVTSVEGLSKDLKTVYYTKDNTTLYKKVESKKEATKISEDVAGVKKIYDNGSMYYVKVEGEDDEATVKLCYYDGKKETVLTEEIAGVAAIAEDAPVIIFALKKAEDATKNVAEDGENKTPTEHKIAVKGKVSSVAHDDAQEFHLSKDGKTVYFLDNKTEGEDGKPTTYDLMKASISGGKMKKAEKYDTEVNDFEGILENGKAYYKKDVKYAENDGSTKFTLYVAKKKVDDDVEDIKKVMDNSNILYEKDSTEKGTYTLKICKGTKATKIADDVSGFPVVTSKNYVLFRTNVNDKGKGDLNVFKGSGKAKVIDQDVQGVIPPTIWEELYYFGELD